MPAVEEAVQELKENLKGFAFDGLVQLKEDLDNGKVIRGSWSGCVISYMWGAPGSCRRDRLGRARNEFTVLWDNGWIDEQDVIDAVEMEIVTRTQVPSRV